MKNVVYILGAGSSQDFGLPLGSEIFDYAHRILKVKEKFVAGVELTEAFNMAEKAMAYIYTNLPENKKKYPPFEEVLTFIWDCRKSDEWNLDNARLISLFEDERGVEQVFDAFVRMMGLTLAGSPLLDQRKNDIGTYTKFIKSLEFDKENISFISLNYDVLLDNILGECVEQKIIEGYTYGVPLQEISDRVDSRQEGLYLLKPHGSLNLVFCGHAPGSNKFGFYYRTDDTVAAITGKLRCPDCKRIPKPLIIPPLYSKNDYIAETAVDTPPMNFRTTPKLYRDYVDNRIEQILRDADEITVVGYSLAAYDYDFRSLLMRSLMSNAKRDAVHLKLVTKGVESQIENLKSVYRHLAGAVTIEGQNGFYNYLKARIRHTARSGGRIRQ
ncbi:MAG: hypothetical protein WBW16_10995 [Bacteroidota bacterium]